MRTTVSVVFLSLLFMAFSGFVTDLPTSTKPIHETELSGPCGCEKGWNFTVHQVTPEGCREKRIYCSEDAALEPGYSCGTCPKPCNTCEVDDNGDLSICRIPSNRSKAKTFKGDCNYLQSFFLEDGSFKYPNDHCGPCNCADKGDLDTDGDGVCDATDDCPNDPNKSKAGQCGCDDEDADNNGVCDSQDNIHRINLCAISGNNTYEWIEEVKINNYLNKSGDNERGHGDYLNNTITVTPGEKLSILITAGHVADVCEISHAIFIDWNRDNDFQDQGEMVMNERTIGETGMDVLLPNDIAMGVYAMRIVTDLGRIYGACGGCIDGEAEDYAFEVVAASCPSVYEGFDYTLDASLVDQDGGTAWSGPWTIVTEGEASTMIVQNVASDLIAGDNARLGVLSGPGSRLTVSRDMNLPIIDANGEAWMSFNYTHDANSVFSPEINGAAMGFYVDRDGFLRIGGLKVVKMDDGVEYRFVIQMQLNSGDDDITLWVNPSYDGATSLFSQAYNAPINGSPSSVGFEFWAAGTNTRKVGQFLDEVRLGCDRSHVVVQNDTSSNATTEDATVNIYPNPLKSGTQVVLEISRSGSLVNDLTIFDGAGQLMHQGIIYAGSNQLVLPYLESGMYVVEIRTAFSTERVQLIVQND